MKILYSAMFIFLFSTSIASACTTDTDCTTSGQTCVGGVCMTSGDVNSKGSGVVTLDNPLGKGVTPNLLIGKVINGVLGVVGSLALIMFIYGGFTWMLSSGNATLVEKGKNILMWAVIGLVIIFSAYALVNFVFKNVLAGA